MLGGASPSFYQFKGIGLLTERSLNKNGMSGAPLRTQVQDRGLHSLDQTVVLKSVYLRQR